MWFALIISLLLHRNGNVNHLQRDHLSIFLAELVIVFQDQLHQFRAVDATDDGGAVQIFLSILRVVGERHEQTVVTLTHCTLQGLDTEMLVRILKEPRNAILKQYQKLLALDEVDLRFEDDALEAIAAKALERDTGARALRSVIEDFMMDIMYEIPKDDNIGTVTITRAFVEGKGGPVISIRTEHPRQIAMNLSGNEERRQNEQNESE